MWIAWAASTALAGSSSWVDVPFQPPETVPLFLKSERVSTKGISKGNDCDAAAQAALEEAQRYGTIVRVVVAPNDLQSAGRASCKQRNAGAAITASLVTLHTLVVTPGAPPAVYPEITSDRAAQIAVLLSVLAQGKGVAAIDDIAGKAWARAEPQAVKQPVDAGQLGPSGRAARAFDEVVRAWVAQWSSVLGGIPEVRGAVLEVEVPTVDTSGGKKSRGREVFRFTVPTEEAGEFVRGALIREEFLRTLRIDWAPEARKRQFAPLDIDHAETAEVAVTPERDLPSADADLPEDE